MTREALVLKKLDGNELFNPYFPEYPSLSDSHLAMMALKVWYQSHGEVGEVPMEDVVTALEESRQMSGLQFSVGLARLQRDGYVRLGVNDEIIPTQSMADLFVG